MKGYKSVLIGAAIYSVVIGVIYVTLAVLSLLARNCVYEDMGGSKLTYMLFIIYFRTDQCKSVIRWDNLNIVADVSPILPDEADAVNRTYIFSIVYLGLYGALIFFALFSLSGINNSCLGRKSFPIFFAPWIVVGIAVIVMDILASVYYILDFVSVLSVDGLLDLLEVGALNRAAVAEAFGQLGAHWRFLPSIIMFVTTCKAVIFLIFDIIIISFVARAGWAASTYHKYVDQTVRNYSSNMSRVNPGFEDTQTEIVAQKQHTRQMNYLDDQAAGAPRSPTSPEPAGNQQMRQTTIIASAPHRQQDQNSTPDRYNDTSPQVFVYPDRGGYRNDYRQPEEKNSIPRPTSLAVQTRYNDSPTRLPNQNDREIDQRMSHYTTSSGNVIRSVEPLKDENISDRQQQQTRVRVLPMVAELNRHSSEVKQKPIPPPKPVHRISQQPSYMDDRRPDSRNSNQKVDRTSSTNTRDELRGQLPWSYFKARDDVPKKAFNELKEDEDLPAVPVPDYTLHFPKNHNKRPNVSDSDGDGSWQRY